MTTNTETLKSLACLRALGAAYRGDWSDFDGRDLAMKTADRDALAAPLLRARLEANVWHRDGDLKVGDEYGDEWEVVSVDDAGHVLTGRTIYVDGETGAASVMDYIDPEWDS